MVSADKSFGTLLRGYRLASGLTQEALGERAGLSFVAVGALERGDRRVPRFETVHRLAEALGLSPADRARFLAAARPSDLPPAPTAEPERPTNLPHRLTSLWGREVDLERLSQLVTERRLVTLSGAAGIGKTRLAQEVGHRIASAPAMFPDGVWFVDLGPLHDPALVVSQIVRVLGIEPRPNVTPIDSLAGALRESQGLLILDNCAHVLEAVSLVAERILATCPRWHILTTSRERLRIEGERVERLSPLGLPPAGEDVAPSVDQLLASPSVGLFLDRAADSGPAQAILLEDPEVRGALFTVAHRLEGIPLAIELAAARMGSLTLGALAQRLDDRFRLLSTGDRTASPRQQTLRATLDWGYELLAEPEQRLLARLGVFAASFSLEAVQLVCGDDLILPEDVPVLLASLVDKSLVIAEAQLAQPSYRLLVMIRSYALERLAQQPGEPNRMQRRHAEYYRTVAERIDAAWAKFGPTHSLAGSIDDVRGALSWALGEHGDPDLAAGLAAALGSVFFSLSLHAEGANWNERALAALGERAQARQEADLQRNIAILHFLTDLEQTRTAAERATARYRQLNDLSNLSHMLSWQALAFYALGDRSGAARLAAEAVEVIENEQQDRYRAIAFSVLALTMSPDVAPARWRLLDEALAFCRRYAPRSAFTLTLTLSACAHVAFEDGDVERALDYARQSFAESPKTVTAELALTQLAYYTLIAGEPKAARAAAKEVLALVPDPVNHAFLRAVRVIAGAAAREGDPVTAARLLGAVDALAIPTNRSQTSADREMRRQAVALLHAALPDEAQAARLMAEGRAMTPAQVIRLALDGTVIGADDS